jgi:ATP-dependent DNA helicase RecG
MHKILNKLLSQAAENEIVEFKEAKNQYDINKLGKYFPALSNEANLKNVSDAWLVFGVKNDKTIVGTSISDNQINAYKHEIAKNTTANLTFIDIYKVTVEGQKVLLLQIPAALTGLPIAWKGHYYGRNGESLSPLNIEELERIRNQVNTTDWSIGTINEASIDDLSPEAIEKARQLFTVKNPSLKDEIPHWDVLTFLNKAKLAIKGKITRTAIILLGKPESEHFIHPAIAKISWILRDKDNIEKDYEHFSCPFLLNVEKARAKIRNLKYRYLQKGTLFPDEVDQYDPYIIREALNNSIAHQDYRLGGKIKIVEKEDGTLTFHNLGNFIPQSIENVIMADAPESKYRNAFLSSAMVNLNMIDTIGSGIRRMFVIQKNKLFPLPEYSFENNSVKVIISGKVMDLAYAEKLAQLPDLSLHEIMLLDKVQKKQIFS